MEKLQLNSIIRNNEDRLKDLRSVHKIPAVVYGHNVSSTSICVAYSDFMKVFKTWWYTHIIQLTIDSKKVDVIINDIQFNPISWEYQHIDFFAINVKEKIRVNIPIVLVWVSGAVKEWWLLDHIKDEIEVECLPWDLIDKFEIDISKLEKVWDVAHLSDINIDKTKFEIDLPEDTPIVSILEFKAEEIKEEAPTTQEAWVAGKEESKEWWEKSEWKEDKKDKK